MNNLQPLFQEIVETDFGISHLELDVKSLLKTLENRNSNLVGVHSSFGYSEEGYPIYAIEVGNSEKRVMSFGRIHGDEDSTTSGILETIGYLVSDKKLASKLLDRCSFVGIPLLNPDGAQKNQRRNSKNVDVNRDFGRYFLFFGSNFKSKEANAARNILGYFKPSYVLDHHDAYMRASHLLRDKGPNQLNGIVEPAILGVWRKKGYDLFHNSLLNRAASTGQLVNYSSKNFCSSTIVEVGYNDSSLVKRRADMHATSDLVAMAVVGYL